MDRETETRVAGLERALRTTDERMKRMGRDLEQAVQLIQAVAAKGGTATIEEDGGQKLPGRYWHCEQCNIRLGFYRDDIDELRLKYKEYIVVIKPGPESIVKIPCVKCGHENRLADSRKG